MGVRRGSAIARLGVPVSLADGFRSETSAAGVDAPTGVHAAPRFITSACNDPKRVEPLPQGSGARLWFRRSTDAPNRVPTRETAGLPSP